MPLPADVSPRRLPGTTETSGSRTLRSLSELPARCVVYDLEFTAWPGSRERAWSGPGEHREIVQVGAVAVDTAGGFAELATLDLLVAPRINPVLSDYFVQLTGITQQAVERDGIGFAEALAGLVEFTGGAEVALVCFGLDAAVLAENCERNGLHMPFAAARLFDARPLLSARLGREPGSFTSGELPRLLGLEPAGRVHDALSDCRAIVSGLREAAAGSRASGT